MNCSQCNKEATIKCSPSRHMTSPNSLKMDVWYCSKECKDLGEGVRYTAFAILDKNSSDSECFEHDHWENGMRVGICKITGNEVKVEPLQPGDNSGQPKECYDHWELNSRYKKYLPYIGDWWKK